MISRSARCMLRCYSRVWNIEMQKFDLQMLEDCFTSYKVSSSKIRLGFALQCHCKGTFAETTSPEHQLHWIFENCKVVRSANGLSTLVEAMKIAGAKHDLLWYNQYIIGRRFEGSSVILVSFQQSHRCGRRSLPHFRFGKSRLHRGSDD